MDVNREWQPWIYRVWLRYPVARCKWADAFGAGYEFARERGRIVKFWTRSGAKAHADRLNAMQPNKREET